ncbi:MAG: hypothetical protein J0H67_02850 [Rhodospirillales bacterium]|nr:hypothetical protein [Rhodospirillales bacterium]
MPMRTLLMLPVLMLPIALAACHQEGPAESAGRKLDNAGQSVRDTLDPPKGPAESVGRKVDRTLND